jgi:hypothetical protein
MAVLQTTYLTDLVPGYAGMVANGETSNRISRTIEDAGGIAFGKGAYRGTGDHGITATPAAGTLLGFTIAHEVLGLLAGQTADVFPQYQNVPILTLGAIWVNAAVAVADNDQVYVTPAGLITNVSSSNVIATGWFFDTTTSGADLARIVRR